MNKLVKAHRTWSMMHTGIRGGFSTCTSLASHKTHFLCCTLHCIPNLWERQKERDSNVFASRIKKTHKTFIAIKYSSFTLSFHAESKSVQRRGKKNCLCFELIQISLSQQTDLNLRLPLAMPITTRIETTAVRCIVIPSLSLLVL